MKFIPDAQLVGFMTRHNKSTKALIVYLKSVANCDKAMYKTDDNVFLNKVQRLSVIQAHLNVDFGNMVRNQQAREGAPVGFEPAAAVGYSHVEGYPRSMVKSKKTEEWQLAVKVDRYLESFFLLDGDIVSDEVLSDLIQSKFYPKSDNKKGLSALADWRALNLSDILAIKIDHEKHLIGGYTASEMEAVITVLSRIRD